MSEQPGMDLIGRLLASFAAINARHHINDRCEIWLNPADAAGLDAIDSPAQLFALPVHVSIGVPLGQVLVFDRWRMEYLRAKGAPPATAPPVVP